MEESRESGRWTTGLNGGGCLSHFTLTGPYLLLLSESFIHYQGATDAADREVEVMVTMIQGRQESKE